MYLADSRNNSAPAERKRRHRPSGALPGTVFALGAVSLITDVSAEMVTAVIPLYLVVGLGMSPLGFGLLDGTQNGIAAVVRLMGGHLADRGGGRHKTVAAVGYGLSALCKPLLLFAHTLPAIIAALAVDRTGKGLRTAPRDAMISLSTPPEHRGRAFGVHRAMDTVGALIGPLVAFGVLHAAQGPLAGTDANRGYDAVFAVSGCIAVLGVLVLLLFVPNRIGTRSLTADAQPSAGLRLRDSLALLKNRGMRRLTSCAFLLGLTTVSDAFLYLLIQRRMDLPAHLFPILPLATAAVFLLLAVPVGMLADRIGRRRMFLAGHAALLAVYALIPTTAAGQTGLLAAMLALHGFFYAATDGVLVAATTEAVPPELHGTGIALVGSGQALARFVCSLAFGAVWTTWGDGTALTLATVGLVLCTVIAAALLRPNSATSEGHE
ncbi:MFS transporter [Streptomyces sp. NPDC054887]